VISLIFALPIVIADLSARKIPNIYLSCYCYCICVVAFFTGFESIALTIFTGFLLMLFHIFGMGMGDTKLIFIICLLLRLNQKDTLVILFALILLSCAVQILISWSVSKVFPASIAMAPAIFLGTGLYLATQGA
jgi:Flp pilus assembly protein protease CpaA